MSSTLASRVARRDAQRFAGRHAELARLTELLADDPAASVVLLHGPGGIGKSTLLREFARRAAELGWTPVIVDARELAPVPGEIERTIGAVVDAERPLIVLDSWERMSALGGWLRERLLPKLPERALVVLAGRNAPEEDWFRGGWEHVAIELPLGPLAAHDARELLARQGLEDHLLGERILHWSHGSPLVLSLAAGAARQGTPFDPDAPERHPDIVRSIVHRVTGGELRGGTTDVVAVAAVARSCDARLLGAVLPGIDAASAEAWLRERSYAEPVGGGIAIHEVVRRAIRAELRASDPERERELRRRLADHLHARAIAGEPRLLVDLAELVENPAIRWGFGAEGSVDYRVDDVRPGDGHDALRLHTGLTGDDSGWWKATQPLFEAENPPVIVARDSSERLAGVCVSVTPASAPAVAEADVLLGPWLAHARSTMPDGNVLIWRDAIDFVAHRSATSPVLAIMNTAAILRSGLPNVRWSYLPLDRENEPAAQFMASVGAVHIPELDIDVGTTHIECHLLDHGAGGIIGAVRAAVYAELAIEPGAPEAPPGGWPEVTEEDVREALRNVHRPLALAESPLARGVTPDERAASVRAELGAAAERAFGPNYDEQLLRAVLDRGYLDPQGNHDRAAGELNLSRATYFRRLRIASERVARYVISQRGG